jgi:hypothetical protein
LLEACESRLLDFNDTATKVSSTTLELYLNIINHTIDTLDHEFDASTITQILDKLKLAFNIINTPSSLDGKAFQAPDGVLETWSVTHFGGFFRRD